MIDIGEMEMSEPDDRYLDFRVLSYQPVAPTSGRIRSVNLLRASFAAFGVLERGNQVIDIMRDTFGLFETGWGFKVGIDGPTWELYWYHEQQEPRTKSIAQLRESLAGFGGLSLDVDLNLPFASFSMDLDEIIDGTDQGVSWLNLYFGNGVDSRCPGLSCRVTSDELLLQNTYFVGETDDAVAMREIRTRILYSPRNGSGPATMELLGRRPHSTRYVYFANKPLCDAIYYSQTDFAFYEHFVDWAGFPKGYRDFVARSAPMLDHLRWDVGYNYVVVNDDILVSKVGVYGYF